MTSIRDIIKSVIENHGDDVFAWVEGKEWRFGQHDPLAAYDQKQVVAIIAPKVAETYYTILSAIAGGHCYVPLSVDWNLSRIFAILDSLSPGLLMCDPAWYAQNAAQLENYAPAAVQPAWGEGLAGLMALERCDSKPCMLEEYRARVGEDDVLYVMFTSGSTGTPKGVPVMRSSADHYVAHMFVDHNHRRSGIGQQLFAQLSDWFAAKKATRETLDIVSNNREGEKFWASLGFKPLFVTHGRKT